MAKRARKKLTQASLSEVKDHFSEYIRMAAKEEVVVTIHGRPAAVIIGFADEDDWLDYRLANDEAFQERVAESRQQYREGKVRELEELE